MSDGEDESVTDQDWAALATQVRARREQLRLPIDLTAVGGPAEMTVRKIESGEPQSIRPKTRTRLERALRWPAGRVDEILAGTATVAVDDVEHVSDLDWAALGRQIKARREALRLPQDLVDRGGPSEFTIRRLERGEADAIRPKTKTQIEHALKWTEGRVDQILDGKQPVDVPPSGTPSEPCGCVVGSPAWFERELATERRIAALTAVYQGEVQRLLALLNVARGGGG